MNGVDTNILVYSLDANEPIKQQKAQQLLRQLASPSQQTVMLWQVLCEFVQQLRRWKDQAILSDAELLMGAPTTIDRIQLVNPLI